MKRLYKSKTNKVLCGVIGGVGEYYEIDPVILRVVYIVVTAFTGVAPGIIAYIIACMVVPQKVDAEVKP